MSLLLLAFLAGFLSFFSPCVFALVPSFLSYLAGVSLAELSEGGEGVRWRVLRRTFAFVAGFSLIFVLFGFSASFLGRLLLIHQTLLRQIGGIIVILFGAHLTGKLPITFLMREKRLPFPKSSRGLITSFGVGVAFSAGWSPCVGPILAAILIYAGAQGSTWFAILLLSVYAFGLGVPFLLAAWFSKPFLEKMAGWQRYTPHISLLLGIILILCGILLLIGTFPKLGGTDPFAGLEQWLLRRMGHS